MIEICMRGNLTIRGLSVEEREELKSMTTFKNPKYEQAKKYSKRKVIYVPKTIEYFREFTERGEDGIRHKVLEVPVGMLNSFDLSESSDVLIRDERVSVEQVYPKFVFDLRNDQKTAFENYVVSPYKNVVQLRTGKGKTILALYIAQHLQQRTLILVHKDDLVVGWNKDIHDVFGGKVKAGLIKAKSRMVGKEITIATVQTLSRMSEDELGKYVDKFGLVVTDECLVGSTLVVMSDGDVKPISQSVSFKSVLGGSVSNQFSRTSNIYELECNNALIKGSPSHPTWCVKKKDSHHKYSIDELEYKQIVSLNSDYLVPVRIQIPHTTKNDFSINRSRLLALIMCDGHLDSTSNRVNINVQKDRLFYYTVMKDACDELHVELKYSHDIRENITYWTNDIKIRYFLEVGCKVPSGKKSNIIEVPNFMYSAPLESIKAFIETCFNCEGDLSSNNNRINFNTCSENFAQGILILLKKFGVVGTINHIRRNDCRHNDIYRISICGRFFNTFMDTFSLLPRKMTKERNHLTKNNNRFIGDYYLSDVKCVSPCGYNERVYDFEVSDSHSFIANGLYTHNCHHVGANTFNIIDKFNSKYKLGLSATPNREDGLTHCLDLYFGGLCHRDEFKADDEDLCGAEIYVRPCKFKYTPFVSEGVVLNYWDYGKLGASGKFLSDIPYKDRPRLSFMEVDNLAVTSNTTKIMVCKDIIKEYRQGHNCIVFFTQKEHIRLYHSYLKRYIPDSKMQMFYGDNNEKSEIIMARAEKGECLVTLATYSKATEGTNVKSWEVGFMVSSLNNTKNIKQCIGRLLRKKDGKLNPVHLYDYQYGEVYSLNKHFNTRLAVYEEYQFKVNGYEQPKKSGRQFSYSDRKSHV